MGALLRFPDGSLAIVLGVVLLAANLPEVRAHGFLAIGLIFLSREVDLVLRDLREIFLTSLHSSRYSGEACASIQLCGRERSGTLVHISLADVQAGAVRVLGSCDTVCTQEVRATRVTIFLFRLSQRTGYIINTVCVFYFSHRKFQLT